MLKRMLLVLMVAAGGTWLATVAMASPAPIAGPAPMCAPALPELTEPPARDCSPRGAGCRYSHDCCSNICRTIKGSKECS
jgi:hypothetical protein